MKNLIEIVADIKPLEVKGSLDTVISGVYISSNLIVEGGLFIAIVGEKADGHNFINEAIEKGARAIVYEKDLIECKDGVTYIKVTDTHEASGYIASAFYNYPSKKLKLVGVTGTNGKTTIATLLHQLFRNLGFKSGMMGTVVNKINDIEVEATLTTPDPITLNQTLATMADAGCEYCFMEVSSRAISIKRIAGSQFAGGIFTNLTHDHLDFHNTMEEYAKVKQEFFTNLPSSCFALSNLDSEYGEYMLESTKAKKYFYSREAHSTSSGQHFQFTGNVETKLIGDFNQSNVLAILGTAVLLGIDDKVAREEIKKLDPAPGRFVSFTSPTGVTGIVDYAHTPDALENVLKTIQNLRPADVGRLQEQTSDVCKIITVVGCGGDRDKAKRPIMAKIAYDLSDILIMTSDNPRTEKVEDILNDMQKGLPDLAQGLSLRQKVYVISDRHLAIQKACELAKSGDYILLAGKGHENYQEVNGAKTHFDDMEELKNCFKKMV
ncbi:UDP-N-acetylmuramoyl-L-alanyl-D-glutamate--2,6-diaminopimelate ligase [Candidatus Nomurabacteria bacterium]|nr:UDP-N-acetylmuramoyl-L-alanyl-D-glutamate--2,6-diaminopimelate ligase [Candidatus Nomurabacteria bacterium]